MMGKKRSVWLPILVIKPEESDDFSGALKASCLLLTFLSQSSRTVALFSRTPRPGSQPRPRLLSAQAPSPCTWALMLFSPPCHHPLLSSRRLLLPTALVWGECSPSHTPVTAASLHLRPEQNDEALLPSVFHSVVLRPATTL